jgi:ATP-dependent DNA helicase PIF1
MDGRFCVIMSPVYIFNFEKNNFQKMKQEIALKILHAGRNVFLTGSAGTGKTHVVNRYIKYLRERGVEPAIVAPTGIAASHIGGKTIHSFFAIGIEKDVDKGYLSWLLRQPFLEKRLSELKVLIVDEISMVSPKIFSSMDKILRAFKCCEKPFGGVQVVLSGDFFQLPPIGKAARTERFVWQKDLWQQSDLKVCYLEEKFRQKDDVLITILEEIRCGDVSEGSMEVFRSRYRKKLINNFRPTKLYTHNIDVDRINEEELGKLPGETAVFESNTKGSQKNIEKIFRSSLVAQEIQIKKGAVVIFIKNNYEKGYINGTLGKVISFSKEENLPIVEIFSGRKITVDMEDWILEDDKGKVKANVEQIPLRLAWALTIHKSQGMTLDAAEIDLSKTFEVGQGYVALSRIRSIEGLRLMGLNDVALMVDELVLGIDSEMKKQSRLNSLKVRSIDKKELGKTSANFILSSGGTMKKEEIEKNREEISKANKDEKKSFKQKKSKEGTVMVTKKMLIDKKTLFQISKARKISPRTIIGHLKKIKEDIPEFDFNHLKLEEKSMKRILQAARQVKKKNSQNDFCENGKMKLRPIFEKLNKKFSYDEISLALLFGDF